MKKPEKIFLSFMPDYFRPILYGMKKYEYRKRFKKEETRAFLYLSSPVQEVVGILELGKPLINEDLIKTLNKNEVAYNRIIKNLENGEKYSIPIKSLQLFKKPISLKQIKEVFKDFFVPHAYLNLENYPKVLEFLESQEMYDKEFVHKHTNLYLENLGATCKEMELTEEFKRLDKEYTNIHKYDFIKAGYLTKGEK